MGFADGENIHNITAYRKMAASFDLPHSFITGGNQFFQKILSSPFLAQGKGKGMVFQQLRRNDFLGSLYGSCQNHSLLLLHEKGKRLHTVPEPLGSRKSDMKTSLLHERKRMCIVIGSKESQILFPAENVFLVRYDNHSPVIVLQKSRCGQCFLGPGNPCHHEGFSFFVQRT